MGNPLKQINLNIDLGGKVYVLGNKKILEETPIYKEMDHKLVTIDGELYNVSFFTHDPSVTVTHIDTNTIAFSELDSMNRKDYYNKKIYDRAKEIAKKLRKEWLDQTKNMTSKNID